MPLLVVLYTILFGKIHIEIEDVWGTLRYLFRHAFCPGNVSDSMSHCFFSLQIILHDVI